MNFAFLTTQISRQNDRVDTPDSFANLFTVYSIRSPHLQSFFGLENPDKQSINYYVTYESIDL